LEDLLQNSLHAFSDAGLHVVLDVLIESLIGGQVCLLTQPTTYQTLSYFNDGVFRQALVYYDDEALYFELKGKDSGIVRFSYEMFETLGEVIEEVQEQEASLQ
jgi:hypothetical protein